MLSQMHPSNQRTRFTLDATGTPVVARVIDRNPDGYLVAQQLPFLKLQSGIWDADGRRGHIAGVAVALDGDTPSLVLEVVYDVRTDCEETKKIKTVRPPRRDHTVPFERPSDAPPRLVALSDPPPAPSADATISPSAKKPAWLHALDAWLDPRVEAVAAWLSARFARSAA